VRLALASKRIDGQGTQAEFETEFDPNVIDTHCYGGGSGPADVLNNTNTYGTTSEYGTSMIIPYNLVDNKTYTLQWWAYGTGFGSVDHFACMDLRLAVGKGDKKGETKSDPSMANCNSNVYNPKVQPDKCWAHENVMGYVNPRQACMDSTCATTSSAYTSSSHWRGGEYCYAPAAGFTDTRRSNSATIAGTGSGVFRTNGDGLAPPSDTGFENIVDLYRRRVFDIKDVCGCDGLNNPYGLTDTSCRSTSASHAEGAGYMILAQFGAALLFLAGWFLVTYQATSLAVQHNIVAVAPTDMKVEDTRRDFDAERARFDSMLQLQQDELHETMMVQYYEVDASLSRESGVTDIDKRQIQNDMAGKMKKIEDQLDRDSKKQREMMESHFREQKESQLEQMKVQQQLEISEHQTWVVGLKKLEDCCKEDIEDTDTYLEKLKITMESQAKSQKALIGDADEKSVMAQFNKSIASFEASMDQQAEQQRRRVYERLERRKKDRRRELDERHIVQLDKVDRDDPVLRENLKLRHQYECEIVEAELYSLEAQNQESHKAITDMQKTIVEGLKDTEKTDKTAAQLMAKFDEAQKAAADLEEWTKVDQRAAFNRRLEAQKKRRSEHKAKLTATEVDLARRRQLEEIGQWELAEARLDADMERNVSHIEAGVDFLKGKMSALFEKHKQNAEFAITGQDDTTWNQLFEEFDADVNRLGREVGDGGRTRNNDTNPNPNPDVEVDDEEDTQRRDIAKSNIELKKQRRAEKEVDEEDEEDEEEYQAEQVILTLNLIGGSPRTGIPSRTS